MPNHEQDPTWGYTIDAKEAFGERYQGRRLIERDGPIDGGVYFGTYGGEALVVDSKKYPEQYDRLFEIAKKKASTIEQRGKFGRKKHVQGEVQRGQVLEAVFETVKEQMKYSQEGVDKTLGSIDHKDGGKVDLSMFMEDGVGVCRHQALVAGVLLEKMKDEGHIRGNVSVDRNMNWSPKGEPSGHAWVRYTSHGGDVVVLDVAQDYLGFLDETVGRKDMWNYLRPEEQRTIAGNDIGHIATPQTAAMELV